MESVPGLVRGRWAFRDTRFPGATVIANPEDLSVEKVMEQFDVTRERADWARAETKYGFCDLRSDREFYGERCEHRVGNYFRMGVAVDEVAIAFAIVGQHGRGAVFVFGEPAQNGFFGIV